MRKLLAPSVLLLFFVFARPVSAMTITDYARNYYDYLRYRYFYRSATTSTGIREGFSSYLQRGTPSPTRPPVPYTTSKPYYPPNREQRQIQIGVATPTEAGSPTMGATEETQERIRRQNQIQLRSQKTQTVITRMLDSYQRRLERYSDFLTKVKSRRDKLETEGKDVTKLDAFIATATNNLEAARAVFDSVKTTLTAIDTTGEMGSLRKNIHDELTTLRLALTTLHKSMSETVAAIVEASVSTTESLTPTGSQLRVRPTKAQGKNPTPMNIRRRDTLVQ